MDSNPVNFGLGALVAQSAELHKYKWNDHLFPISILATLHALRGALFARYSLALSPKTTDRVVHIPWLQALIFNLVLSLGGGIATAFLFGHHVFWLNSNQTLPLYCAVHLLIMYSPFDIIFKLVNSFWYIINPVLVIADGLNRGFTMISAVDYLRNSAHDDLRTSYVAMILGGTVAACGGGLLVDFFGLNRIEWGVHTPNFTRQVPFAVKTTFFLTLGYVISISPELPIYHHLITLVNQLCQYVLPDFKWSHEGSDVNFAFLHFVFRASFVFGLLFDEFFNRPLVCFVAPEPDQATGAHREISDLSVFTKLEETDNRPILPPSFQRLTQSTHPSSEPATKSSLPRRKLFNEDSDLTQSRVHVPTKSSNLN